MGFLTYFGVSIPQHYPMSSTTTSKCDGLQNRDALHGMDVNKVLNLEWVSIEPKLMLLENFHHEAK